MNALYIAWRSGGPAEGGWGPVGRLEHEDGLFRFFYTRGAKQLAGFRPFPQMERLETVYESSELYPVFANRLLSQNRPEYEAYLRWGGFDASDTPDPLAVLGVTEGIRQTDSLELFPCPTPDVEGCYLNKFFLHGIRWLPPAALDRTSRLSHGEALLLMPDPGNAADPNAVAVRTVEEPTLIGYVPRYLAHDFRLLLQDCEPNSIRLTVERYNRDAPSQQRVLCRLRTCWPADFQPCSGPLFAPLPAEVASRA